VFRKSRGTRSTLNAPCGRCVLLSDETSYPQIRDILLKNSCKHEIRNYRVRCRFTGVCHLHILNDRRYNIYSRAFRLVEKTFRKYWNIRTRTMFKCVSTNRYTSFVFLKGSIFYSNVFPVLQRQSEPMRGLNFNTYFTVFINIVITIYQ